jgi:hypothetical protein
MIFRIVWQSEGRRLDLVGKVYFLSAAHGVDLEHVGRRVEVDVG